MSVAFSLRATDGLVVVADGRTSGRNAEGELVPRKDRTVKVAPVPYGLPVAVVVLGRATINGIELSQFVQRALSEIPRETLREMTVAEIGDKVVHALARGARSTTTPALIADEGQVLVGFHILVAGYDPGSHAESEARVLYGGFAENEEPLRESDDGFTLCQRGFELWPAVNERVSRLLDRTTEAIQSAPSDSPAILDSYTQDYVFEGLTMDEIVASLPGLLKRDIQKDRTPYDESGVGGRWILAKLAPVREPEVLVRDIGPMMRTL